MRKPENALVLAFTVLTAAAACATSPAPERPREAKEPGVAREVVVRTKVEDGGRVLVTPDPVWVRAGQRLVFDTCCEALRITWKKPVKGIPEPRCAGGECTLVAPPVNEPTEVLYDVSGKCGGKEFRLDPRIIFTR